MAAVFGTMSSILSVIVVLYIQQTFSARILVLFPPSYSAITPLLPAIEELYTKYGHKSTVVTNKDLAKGYENATFNYIISDGLSSKFKHSKDNEKLVESGIKGEKITNIKIVTESLSSMCNGYLTDMDLTEKLKKESFDIAITSNGPYGICLNIIPYKLSIPFVLFGNINDPVNDRLPISPSFIPHQFLPFGDKMSFTERLVNTLAFFIQSVMPDMITPPNAMAKYAPEKPYISTSELMRKAELHLLDTDPLLDFPRTMFPNYVYVGGMVAHRAKPLVGDLKEFMDSARNGAVIVSFGSLVKLPKQVVETLMNVFKRLNDVKFVFKHGNEAIQKGNVFCFPWIPQNDLLGHHNTKVFVTHCGNSGQIEAVFHGVPMVGIPFYGDQFNNAKRIESKGYGKILSLTEMTSDQIVHSINDLLTNAEIRNNIKTASNIFRSRPQSPKEKASYWIDHVIKYGGQYMRPAHLDMPFYQYVLLDVVLFLLFIVSAIIATVVFVTKKICKFCCGRKIKTD